MKSVILLIAVLGCIQAKTMSHQLEGYTFDQYLAEYNKVYDAKEYGLRREIFERNLEQIIAHNSQPNVSFTRGVNQFTDQTNEEKQRLNGYTKSVGTTMRSRSNAEVFKPTGIEVPASFDWRDVKPSVLSPVKNQGHCGSCWTFAAAATLESHWAIATGHLEDFSEQQIASCAANPLHCGGTGGCSGGTAQIAFQHVIDNGGIASEWTYPYISYPGQDYACKLDAKATPSVAQFESYVNIETNNYEGLLEALVTKGPISVSVDASTWHSYEGGVFDGCNTVNPDVNHAVQLVGYGTDPVHGDYWTIRNSWAPTWGEHGHIRIRRSKTGEYCGVDVTPQDGSGCDGGPSQVTVCGMCGILFDNTFPVARTSSKVENFLQ